MTGRSGGVLVTPVGAASGLDAAVVGSDDAAAASRLERRGAVHAVVIDDAAGVGERTVVILLPVGTPLRSGGIRRREVLVGGWRIEVEIESARRAGLRERATRADDAGAHGGTHEVRAIIPGRVVSVAVSAGDEVVTGQRLLVVEAMKMQNELRAPRPGVVATVAAGAGQTVELGDLLVVLE